MKISIEKEIVFNNKKVAVIKIINENNDELVLSNYGATIMSIKVHTNINPKKDITLGYDNIEDYINNSETNNEYYFGSTVGRYANRISNACFTINDKAFKLSENEGQHHLHGGFNGFNKVVWDYNIIESNNEVIFKYKSNDGEEGYPGNLDIDLSVSLNDLSEIKLKYKATTNKPTPVNLTNHVYFNLNGGNQDISNHIIKLNSNYILETDQNNIPTGKYLNIINTDFDFNTPKRLGDLDIMQNKGFDNTYVLNKPDKKLDFIGEICEYGNPVSIEIYTTEPSIQLYTANSFDGTFIGKNNKFYKKFQGLCIETQNFPDSPNHKNFPDSIIYPDDLYEQETIYKIKKTNH